MTPGQINQARIKALEEAGFSRALGLAKEWLATRDSATLKQLAEVVLTVGTIEGQLYRQFTPVEATTIGDALSRCRKTRKADLISGVPNGPNGGKVPCRYSSYDDWVPS